MRWLLHHIIALITANAIALWVATQLLPTQISLTGEPIWAAFLVVAAVLGTLNLIVKPVLKLLSLPLVFITMGLFLVVINGVIVYLLEYSFANILNDIGCGIALDGSLITYVIVGAVLGFVNSISHWVLK